MKHNKQRVRTTLNPVVSTIAIIVKSARILRDSIFVAIGHCYVNQDAEEQGLLMHIYIVRLLTKIHIRVLKIIQNIFKKTFMTMYDFDHLQ